MNLSRTDKSDIQRYIEKGESFALLRVKNRFYNFPATDSEMFPYLDEINTDYIVGKDKISGIEDYIDENLYDLSKHMHGAFFAPYYDDLAVDKFTMDEEAVCEVSLKPTKEVEEVHVIEVLEKPIKREMVDTNLINHSSDEEELTL